MHRIHKIFLLIGLCFFTGCVYSSNPLGKPLPSLTYDNLVPYSIQGGSVIIQQSFIPDSSMVALSKELPVPPDVLLRRYASKRFVTSGAPPKLVFDIKNAALVKISDDDNILGYLSGAAEDHYTLNISITMVPIRADGQKTDPFKINLTRRMFIPQNASLAERDIRKFELLEKAIHDVDKTVTEMVGKMTPNYF